MDNQRFDVSGEGLDLLGAAIDLRMHLMPFRDIKDVAAGAWIPLWLSETAEWYDRPEDNVGASPVLVFAELGVATHGAYSFHKLPAPLDAGAMAQTAAIWLQKHKDDTLALASGFDGSVHLGWRVFVEQYGQVGPIEDAIVAIQPIPALYGK